MSGWAHVWEWTSIVFLLMFIVYVSYSTILIVGMVETPKHHGPIFAGLFLMGYFSIPATGICSDRYVKRTYSDRHKFLRHKFSFKTLFKSTSIINFNMQILYSIQCDAILKYFHKKGISITDTKYIDYLISYYTEESERIRKRQWLPFAILITLSLPGWPLLIKSILEGKWSNIGFVLLIALVLGLTVFVTLIKKVLDILLFKVSNDYLLLANILRTIKSYQ